MSVTGIEIRTLCGEYKSKLLAKAERADKMADLVEQESNANSNVRKMNETAETMRGHAREMDFIAAHIVPEETYLLDHGDLSQPGVLDRYRS